MNFEKLRTTCQTLADNPDTQSLRPAIDRALGRLANLPPDQRETSAAALLEAIEKNPTVAFTTPTDN